MSMSRRQAIHRVLKFFPTTGSFAPDPFFGKGGYIGTIDKSAGSLSGQFNAPFDVAITADGNQIYVSDSNNHRIQVFDRYGNYVAAFGSQGAGFGQFNTPKGLTLAPDGSLIIADSGNYRLVLCLTINNQVQAITKKITWGGQVRENPLDLSPYE